MRIPIQLLCGLLLTGVLGFGAAQGAPNDVAIILVHGGALLADGKKPPKQDNSWTINNRGKLIDALEAAGYRVVKGVFPWAAVRNFDRPFEDGLAEIDAYVRDARKMGAREIVVLGASMGANATLAYAAAHPDISGVIVTSIGPGPNNPLPVAEAVETARTAIINGGGDKPIRLVGTNSGAAPYRVLTTPRIYYSYYGPDGAIAWDRAYRAIRADLPILLVSGEHDRGSARLRTAFGDKPNARERSLVIVEDAQHFDIMEKAANAILEWLRRTFPK